MTIAAVLLFAFAFLVLAPPSRALTYQYFAVGSNVQPNTMTCLRDLHPLNASAAVLPGYRLVFNVRGNPLVEPSAAAALKSKNHNDCIHGAVYELTEKEFRELSRSEGVPFAYRWDRCTVYRYQGDNGTAGAEALALSVDPVPARVLVAQLFAADTSIPPSPSYLKIIQDGAKYWKLDQSYQHKLASVKTARNLLIPDGLSGRLLRTAETFNPRKLGKF
eukprot:scaffold11998_cov174-Amphora_coffeaeformis.AAC.19